MKFLGNFMTRATRFFKETRFEIRKVVWPGRQETIVYTSVVILSVIAISVFMWVMDNIFSLVLGLVI